MQIKMRLRISGDRKEIRQSYVPTLFPRLVIPLQERGNVSILLNSSGLELSIADP